MRSWIAWMALAAVVLEWGCNPSSAEPKGAGGRQSAPRADAEVQATEEEDQPEPDDPRVKCPPGTKQHHFRSSGLHDITCIDQRGIPNGPYLVLWEGAGKQKEATYARGRFDGTWRTWYENGVLESEMTFANGQEEGRSRYWFETGKLQGETWWHEGEKVGLERWWDERGRIREQVRHPTPPGYDPTPARAKKSERK